MMLYTKLVLNSLKIISCFILNLENIFNLSIVKLCNNKY